MTQKERMEKGLVYDPGDAEILTEQAALCANIRKYNECADPGKRAEMLKEMLAEDRSAPAWNVTPPRVRSVEAPR